MTKEFGDIHFSQEAKKFAYTELVDAFIEIGYKTGKLSWKEIKPEEFYGVEFIAHSSIVLAKIAKLSPGQVDEAINAGLFIGTIMKNREELS